MIFLCKSCGFKKEIPDKYAGKTVKCPQCKAAVKIPEDSSSGENKYSIAGIDWDITMMKKVAGMLSGGLFNVKLTGQGMIAITTQHDPVTLRVSPGEAVITDPNATVAWSGSLSPELKTDVSFKTFLGRGSGESNQMRFDGEGFVVVQPYEELYMQGK